MAGGKGKSGGKSSGGKTGADGNKKQQSHSSKAGLQVSTIEALVLRVLPFEWTSLDAIRSFSNSEYSAYRVSYDKASEPFSRHFPRIEDVRR